MRPLLGYCNKRAKGNSSDLVGTTGEKGMSEQGNEAVWGKFLRAYEKNPKKQDKNLATSVSLLYELFLACAFLPFPAPRCGK